MRALSVRQPWASLIASGRKTIELRCWRTHFRGELLIVSGGRPWKECAHGFELGPMGVTIGVVELVDCVPFTEAHRAGSCIPDGLALDPQKEWFSWVLKNARTVPNVPTSGMLKLFEPDATLLQAIGIQ